MVVSSRVVDFVWDYLKGLSQAFLFFFLELFYEQEKRT
ncbi:MAG: hypothetical protein PWQ91_327 [Eubacteriales bacterium]|nr:hypothetical protein [Eubacteriales bacterium]MDN5363266.1 hypothetical protein [Eubacteriales bacterium]